MVHVAKLSTKGQITVPKAIRKRINLQSGDRILFIEDEESIKIQRLPANIDPADLFGSLEIEKGKQVDIKEQRDLVRKKMVNKNIEESQNSR
jgi:AbrB family looped-hinge helix DNA binding protein